MDWRQKYLSSNHHLYIWFCIFGDDVMCIRRLGRLESDCTEKEEQEEQGIRDRGLGKICREETPGTRKSKSPVEEHPDDEREESNPRRKEPEPALNMQ
jgi:hypothetical protein